MAVRRHVFQRVTQGTVLCDGEQQAERQNETQPCPAHDPSRRLARNTMGSKGGNHRRWARLLGGSGGVTARSLMLAARMMQHCFIEVCGGVVSSVRPDSCGLGWYVLLIWASPLHLISIAYSENKHYTLPVHIRDEEKFQWAGSDHSSPSVSP